MACSGRWWRSGRAAPGGWPRCPPGSYGWAAYEVQTPLLYHATGGVLSQLASPTPSGTLADIAHVPGAGSEMWAVGAANGEPLILHHA